MGREGDGRGVGMIRRELGVLGRGGKGRGEGMGVCVGERVERVGVLGRDECVAGVKKGE